MKLTPEQAEKELKELAEEHSVMAKQHADATWDLLRASDRMKKIQARTLAILLDQQF